MRYGHRHRYRLQSPAAGTGSLATFNAVATWAVFVLCCACCTPDTPGVPSEVSWVRCDECDGWFHSYCVRVPDAVAETLDSFRCPRCCTLAGAAYAFGSAALPPPILTTSQTPSQPSHSASSSVLAGATAALASLAHQLLGNSLSEEQG